MHNRRIKKACEELKKDKMAVFALSYLLCVILISLLVVFINIDPNAIEVTKRLDPPSIEHWFGTDEVGRDYFIRVLYGGRISLLVGVLAMLTSVVIGVSVGMVSGFYGGIIDSFLMRTADVFSSIPWIIMITVISLLFKRGILTIIIVIGLFSWMEIARLVRAEVLSLKEREYIQYAIFIGVHPLTIMRKHMLPATASTIITAATSSLASAIMVESSLSFLGLGVAPPMASWGSLLESSQKFLQKAPYMAILPGVLIIITIYSFNKLGNVLRVSVEPKVIAGEKDE